MPESNPTYVRRGGEQAYPAPFQNDNARLSGFVLRADPAAMQKLVDRYLNTPAGGAVDYRALGDFVLLIHAPIGAIRSLTPPEDEMGYTAETDVGFWMLVGAGHTEGGLWVLDRLAWFLPYLWVDNSTTVVTGRETYGYPKQYGWVNTETDDESTLLFNLDTLVLPQFSPNTPLERQPLIRVERTGGGLPAPLQVFDDVADALENLVQIFIGSDGSIVVPGLDLLVNVLEYLVNGEIPLVFLKQYRDIVQPNTACYQAIVESPAKVTDFHGGGLLLDEFLVTIEYYPSHPVVRDLGLDETVDQTVTVTAEAAFHVEFDFLTELATVVWKA